ncbi:MAG: YncE family protein [Chloroflexota bacterium]
MTVLGDGHLPALRVEDRDGSLDSHLDLASCGCLGARHWVNRELARQSTFEVADGPMGVAFHPDGQAAVVDNHGDGRITIVDLAAGRPSGEFAAGVGVETLAFY